MYGLGLGFCQGLAKGVCVVSSSGVLQVSGCVDGEVLLLAPLPTWFLMQRLMSVGYH
jgi:hypothetical protein